MRILLVDDEAEIADPLGRVLRREGYDIEVVYDGAAGLASALRQPFDLLILDWMLPQYSGLEICQRLRHQGDRTPVLFLTAKDTVDDRVQGLDAGADDYLVKPFELRELLARVRALLRRPPSLAGQPAPEPTLRGSLRPDNPRLQVEDFVLDIPNQLAYHRDRRIELSDKETQLLGFLMQHPDQLLTHDQFYQQLWGETEKPTSNVLAAQIRLLRRKIETDGEPPLIQTVYGRGYRFGMTQGSA